MVSKLNTVPTVLLICTLISFGLTVFFGITAQNAYEGRIALTANALRFIGGSKTLTDEVRAYATTGDKAHFDAYWYEANTAKNRETGLEGMRKIGITDKEESMIAEMSKISNELVPLESQAMDSVQKGDRSTAIESVYGERYSKDIAQIGEIVAQFRRAIDERTSSRVASLNLFVMIMGIVTGVLILAIIFVQFRNMRFVHDNLADPMMKIRAEMTRIADGKIMMRFDMPEDASEVGQLVAAIKNTKRNLRKYVSDISNTLSLMADGRLDARIDMDYIGDFAPIKESLDGILDSLNEIVGRLSRGVRDTASAITVRADRLLAGADELALDSSGEAKSIEELSQTVNDLAREMNEIADTAARSFASTEAAASELAASNAQMHEMQEAMNAISEASEGIKKINDTIANIGSRTTIVALNAAIEAAKAGAVGRGFSVVADEVRNLAVLCGDASRDTNAMLASTMQAVNKGIELTQNMTDAMETLISASRESSKDISDISEQSKRQAASLMDLAGGFDQITNVVHKTAETAEASAAAAKDLTAQAAHLDELSKSFDMFTLREQK